MLYPKNKQPLSEDLFKNPTSEYRGTPFWAWNTNLNSEELTWQIEQLKKMGFGGFHMHSRTGMATEYLSDEFMKLVKDCVEKARSENMLAWLYDEDRWPSGAAGGLVTKNPKYRARHLLLTRNPYNMSSDIESIKASAAVAGRTGNGKLIACFDVVLSEEGTLASYRQISESDGHQGFKLYAYDEMSLPSPWFNNETYVDTLNPEAIKEFIQITYERYFETTGKDFGGIVPAIFTDEPQFPHKGTLGYAHDERDITLPWTTDFPETYKSAYGERIVDHLPELLWDLPNNQPSAARYYYHDHVAERFASAFADQCGAWCGKHGIALTGHMMEEPTLMSQTAALGEAMRSYRSFQLPGIDMLCDSLEFTTAKQAQSAARQYGCPGVLSELYGVTNWDFDFRGHKLQGDWQAALGVTVRVPHLSWVSMNGEAKRDYPSTFNYQSPWYQEYPYIENHFARVNTAMTRGKAVCRVGVIHPIESYWLHWGARETTAAIRSQMEDNFNNITKWLLCGCIDFDYICESQLPSQCNMSDISEHHFTVGAMDYNVIIVPELETIRDTTLKRLERFADHGGCVIFLGSPPKYVDAAVNSRALELYKRVEQLPFNKLAVLNALKDVREVEIKDVSGTLTDDLIYQLREEEGCRWLFIAHAGKPINPDIPDGKIINIKVRGNWAVTIYDTLSGDIRSLAATVKNGWTEVSHPFYEHDSLLLKLVHSNVSANDTAITIVNHNEEGSCRFLSPVPVTLHEPNVLLLDMAEYALDDDPYRKQEEILRLDNILRRELSLPTREVAIVQPWVQNDTSILHVLKLRFTLESKVKIKGAELALENAAITEIMLNGQQAKGVSGWYVDKCIGKVPLPDIQIGRNVLELKMPYGKKMDVEACYLLGDFGVQVVGCRSTLISPVKSLCFGDIVTQGLPFYGGNITYHLDVETAGSFEIGASCYRGHLLRAAVDDKDAGVIAFSPYRLKVEGINCGKHKIDLTYFGSRVNTFGQLHRVNRHQPWWGPNSWRTTGDSWSYEYLFWPQGVLKSIEIFDRTGG